MLVVPKAVSVLLSKQKNSRFKVLNQPSQFSSVLQARQRLVLQPEARFIELFYQRNKTNDTVFRLGMVVSRRVAPNAVTRNMVKRQWREVFRLFCLANSVCLSANLPSGNIGQLSNSRVERPMSLQPVVFDVVLRARPLLKTAYQTAKRDKKLSALRQQIRAETQALLLQLRSLA